MQTVGARRLGVVGLIFVVLLVITFVMVPSTPGTDASAAKVMSYYRDHKTALEVQAYLISAAVIVGVFFFWYFRNAVAVTERDRHLATIGFAGGVMFAATGGLAAGLLWAATDAAHHGAVSSTRAFNILQMDATAFLGGAGVAILLLATSAAILLGKAFPVWFGWVGVVLGVATFALGLFVGPLSAGLWVLIGSIVLLTRHETPTAPEPRVPVMTDT